MPRTRCRRLYRTALPCVCRDRANSAIAARVSNAVDPTAETGRQEAAASVARLPNVAIAARSTDRARRATGHVLFGGGDLLFTRWLLIVTESVAVLLFGVVLRLPVRFETVAAAILAAILFNLAVTIYQGTKASALAGENAFYLAFDTLQLAALLWLTGGSANPFCLALALPARMAGVILPARLGLALVAATLALIAMMTAWPTPLPWAVDAAVTLPLSYRCTCGVAVGAGVLFGYGFGWWTARQAARMELALGISETVLAREQRLSALGALAAATAHELGSPLATIAVVARELSRDAPEGPLRDDALLVVGQVSRCRDILQRLAQGPEQSELDGS